MKMSNSWTTLFDQHTLLHKQSKNPIMRKLSPSKQYVCNSTRGLPCKSNQNYWKENKKTVNQDIKILLKLDFAHDEIQIVEILSS